MREYIKQECYFEVLEYDKRRNVWKTSIGDVDPFVSNVIDPLEAEYYVGRRVRAYGFFSGTFIPSYTPHIIMEGER